MKEQPDNGADAPADDLRSMLSSAFDEAENPKPVETTAPDSEAQDGTRARDEAGRFTKTQVTDSPAAAAAFDVAPKAQEQQPAADGQQTATQQTVAAGPPPGWSVPAKAAFDALPPAVKEAIAKRESEVNQGFQKLADYKGLDQFVDMARQNGKDLSEVLNAYTAAEEILSRDFVGGIAHICQMYGVDPRALAAAFNGGEPPQGQQPNDPFTQRLSGIEQTLQQLMGSQQQREAEFARQENESVQSEIQRFASDPAHKYFENVRADMGILYQAGKATTLEDAYQQACWLNPEIRDLQIKEQFAKQQADTQKQINQKIKASGSLPPGAPLSDAGVVPKNQSLRAALEASWDSAGAQI